MSDKNYDFSGIATAYEVLCDDGRVIKDGAFDHQDGETVPVVWRHMHTDIRNYLGHARLTRNEGQPLGIRSFSKFNKTAEGRKGKALVEGGEVESLSIWANDLIEHSGNFEIEPGIWASRAVEKGTIREISLVVKGMNPGAKIDDVIRHSDDPLDPESFVNDGIIVHSGIPIDIDFFDEEAEEEEAQKEAEVEEAIDETVDADDSEKSEEGVVEGEGEVESEEEEATEEGEEAISHEDKTIADVLATLNTDQMKVVSVILHSALTGETPAAVESEDGETNLDLEEVFNTLNQEQKDVVEFLAGDITSQTDEDESEDESEESMSQGDKDMSKTYNPFEQERNKEAVIAHESVLNTLMSAKTQRAPSLRELMAAAEIDDSVLQHSITDVDFLFPDARSVKPGGPDYFADRQMGWVRQVLNGVRPRPFSRIKSWYADISADTARAKGYVTAAQKVEEVIAVLKRTTTPQTIYKLQKLDRDDVLDITDFNVVVWLKAEMRMMLEEELARAVLVGDGRSGASADKIVETNVRPIYNDDFVYTHKAIFNDVGNEQDWSAFTDTEALAFLDHIAGSLAYYRGAGSPVLYCAPELITKLLLVRDTTGRRIHDNLAALAAAMRVREIVEVPVISGLEDTGVVDPTGVDQVGNSIPAGTYDIATLGVIVNLTDYVIGADNGGETAFFDDFDLNFNKYEYLYETRVSGALVVPKSAIAVQLVTAKTA